MKRIISVILTIAMMTAVCPFATATEEVTEKKVFSLDFSGYATGGSIKNGVTSSATGITTHTHAGNTDSTGPVVGKDYTVDGDVIDYIEFSDDALFTGTNDDFKSSHNYGVVQLDATLMQTLLAGTDDFTIEFWAKPYANYKDADSDKYYATANSIIYKYGPGNDSGAGQIEIYAGNSTASSSYNNTYNIETWGTYTIRDKDGNWVFNPGSQYSRTPLYLKHTDNDWLHFVVTREWRYDDDTKTTGDYYGAVYLDGVDKTKASTSNSTAKANVVKSNDTNLPFTIGGMVSNTGTTSYVFDGAIAEFNIYNYAMDSTEATALYGVNSAKYKAERLGNSISLASASPESESTIKTAPGTIELTFDNFVADSSVDKIKMYDENNNEVSITKSKAQGYSKTVTVQYGELTDGKPYTLVIPADFESVNGYTFGIAKTLTYNVSNSTIVENYDFTQLPENNWKVNGTAGTDYVLATHNGVNAIHMNNNIASFKGFGYKLAADETRDFKITVSVSGDGNSGRVIRWGYSTTLVNIGQISSFAQYSPDENNFITFTAELLYDRTDGLYDVYLYDCNGTLLGQSENKNMSGDCEALLVVHSAGDGGGTTFVSQYKVEELVRPEVASHNLAAMAPDEAAMNLVFNQELDPATISECATLTDSEGAIVPIEIGGYNTTTKTLSIKPLTYLYANSSYTLALNNIENTDGLAIAKGYTIDFTTSSYVTVGDVTFKNQSGATITNLQGATSVSLAVRVTNTMDTKQKYTAYIVWCDSAGNVKAPIGVFTGEAVKDAYVDLTPALSSITPAEGDCVKCFIWGDNATGGSKPYATQTTPVILQY